MLDIPLLTLLCEVGTMSMVSRIVDWMHWGRQRLLRMQSQATTSRHDRWPFGIIRRPTMSYSRPGCCRPEYVASSTPGFKLGMNRAAGTPVRHKVRVAQSSECKVPSALHQQWSFWKKTFIEPVCSLFSSSTQWACYTTSTILPSHI